MNEIWVYNPHGQSLQGLDGISYREVADIAAVEGDYYLAFGALGVIKLCDRQNRHKPLTIDFSKPYYRFRGGTEWLPKALKGLVGVKVADATAGWARDAWLLAYRGFQVTLFERNPYLQALLRQGISQAQINPSLTEVAARLTLNLGDAKNEITKFESFHFDVIYLDPMYPVKRKKAKVKKDMQALQQLLLHDIKDETGLFDLAMSRAKQRVIVKRPKGAATLSDLRPSYTIDAPNTRFDVYLC